MNDDYYLRSRGKVSGPFDATILAKKLRRGAISRFDEASTDQIHWQQVGQLCPLALDSGSGKISLTDAARSAVEPVSDCGADRQGHYYYQHDGLTIGPIPEGLLIKLAKLGKIEREDLIWQNDGPAATASHHPLVRSTFDQPLNGETGEYLLPKVMPRLLAIVLYSAFFTVAAAIGLWIAVSDDQFSRPSKLSSSEKIEKATIPPEVSESPKLSMPPASAPVDTVTWVSNSHDERSLAATVGLVVVGFEVAAAGGETFDGRLVTGSCFVVSPRGFLLTNRHVIDGALKLIGDPDVQKAVQDRWGGTLHSRVWVFFEGNVEDAQVVYVSNRYDLAVLQIKPRPTCFQVATTSSVARGTEVFAAGFPAVGSEPLNVSEFKRDLDLKADSTLSLNIHEWFKSRDFEYTLTKGAIGRVYKDEEGTCLIQHEAVVRHGNSGGPLLTSRGCVVGINTLIQRNAAGDVQTNLALDLSQLRQELDDHVPGMMWVNP